MSSSIPIRNILITGTSRGLGLEFVRQYVSEPNTRVIATARNVSKATALQELKQKHSNLTLIELDVSSPESIHSSLSSLPAISLLINNAGINLGGAGVSDATINEMKETFNTNVIGVLTTIQSSLYALQESYKQSQQHPLVINITSELGSIKGVNEGLFNGTGCVAYRISKTAVNMLTATAAKEFKDITFISLHPGWVNTDLGSVNGKLKPPLSPEQSVSSMKHLISNIKHEKSGLFFSYDGKQHEF